jgi:ADP-ribosylglycohydrolase
VRGQQFGVGVLVDTLAAALWALRQTRSFDDSLRAAIDLGGDTDTIAAVTGGLAGAVYGIDAIPIRWVQMLFVPLPGFGRTYTAGVLREFALRLDTEPVVTDTALTET